jgi:hypothetical protein
MIANLVIKTQGGTFTLEQERPPGGSTSYVTGEAVDAVNVINAMTGMMKAVFSMYWPQAEPVVERWRTVQDLISTLMRESGASGPDVEADVKSPGDGDGGEEDELRPGDLSDSRLLSHLHTHTDGVKWAEEFGRVHARVKSEGGDLKGLTIAWFCNAIEAGRSAGMKQEAEELTVMRDDRDRWQKLCQFRTEERDSARKQAAKALDQRDAEKDHSAKRMGAARRKAERLARERNELAQLIEKFLVAITPGVVLSSSTSQMGHQLLSLAKSYIEPDLEAEDDEPDEG